MNARSPIVDRCDEATVAAWLDRAGADDANRRLSAAWREADAERGPVLLFGCGPLGRHTAAALRTAGRTPVAFVDNDAARWGSSVEGLRVLSPAEAVAAYHDTGLFVVTIYNGSAVRAQLRACGCRRVLHFMALYHGMPQVFLPYFQVDRAARLFDDRVGIDEAESLWADAASLRTYRQLVAARLGRPEVEAQRVEQGARCYFDPDLFALDADDVVVDCGAFDGDTVRSVLALNEGQPTRIVALEPDPRSAARLRAFVDGLDAASSLRITVVEAAVSSTPGSVPFDAAGTVASTSGRGALQVEAVALDAFPFEAPPTLIKMDVEGHELEALRGAVDTMRSHAPILAVSLYHRPDDLWRIPAFVHAANPDYALFLRCYAEDGWECVLYAVPPHRRLPPATGESR